MLVAALTALAPVSPADAASGPSVTVSDPTGDVSPSENGLVDATSLIVELFQTSNLYHGPAPDPAIVLRVPTVLGGTAPVPTSPTGPGLTALVEGSGHTVTGQTVSFSAIVYSQGADAGAGRNCPLANLTVDAGEVDVQLDDVPTCLGARLVDVSLSVTLRLNQGSTTYTDRVPDTGSTPTVDFVPGDSDLPGLRKGGTEYMGNGYADTAAPEFAFTHYGNPGDTLLTTDNSDTYGTIDTVPSFIAVRPQAGGGLRWYRQYVAHSGSYTVQDFSFGNVGDIPVAGDWDGDGRRTLGVFRPSTGQWFLTDDPGFVNSPGAVITALAFGSPGDQPVSGDWTGGGYDTPAVFRGGFWYETTSLHSGGADRVVGFGSPGDIAVPGIWNGTSTGLGVYRAGRWYITNDPAGGTAQNSFRYGDASYAPLLYNQH